MLDTSRQRSPIVKIIKSDESRGGGGRGGEAGVRRGKTAPGGQGAAVLMGREVRGGEQEAGGKTEEIG